jgi:type IV pilus assembly protein PilA
MVRDRARAFTLVEAMIVAVIVGALAVIALVGYRRWVRTAYLAEAQDMVGHIRAAQESFRSENGGYFNVSNGLGPGHDYPLLTPGKSKTAWGGACSACNNTATGWGALNVASAAPVAFGYSSIASVLNGSGQYPAASASLKVNGTAINLTAMSGGATPWYIIEADGDQNGDGVFTNVYGLSATNQIYVNDEGE